MKKIFILAFLLFAGKILFSIPYSDIPSQTSPFGDSGRMVFADFDLDGDLDVVQIIGQNNVAWGVLLENYRGFYQINSMYGFNTLHHGASAVAAGDVNNDGRMDLAVNVISNRLMVLRNNGGGFEPNNPAWFVPDVQEDISDVLFGDFNNDGNLDLAVARASNRNLILQGDGNFGFAPVLSLPRTNDTFSLASGDFNRDGNIDLVTANRSKSNVVYFLNGSFGIQRAWTNKRPHDTFAVAAGDINNDNWLDIVFGKIYSDGNDPKTNVIEVYTNNHASSFGLYQSIYQSYNWNTCYPFSLSLGDIDNDRDLDLAVSYAYPREGPLYIYTNANGRLGKSAFNQNDQKVQGSCELVDIDSDGDLDLYSSFIYENKSPVFASEAQMKWPGGVKSVAGFQENYLLLEYYDKVVIGRPSGGGGGSWNWSGWPGYTNRDHGNITCCAAGDVNGVLSFNDRSDYIVATRPGWIYVYTNNSPNWSTLTFQLSWSNRVRSGYCVEAMALGDVNGDGAPDLFYAISKTNGGGGGNDTNAGLFLLFNQQGGFNTNKIKLPPMEFAGGQLFLTGKELRIDDLDNDGDNDLLSGGGGPDLIYFNKGGGIFDESTSCYPEISDTECMDLGDIDGDGDLDVIRGNRSSFSYLYLNNNGVVLPTPSWQSPTFTSARSVKLFDVDHDGDLDLGLASEKNYPTFIMRNKGNGLGLTENDYIWQAPGMNNTYSSIVLYDFDGDNDAEIFLAGDSDSGTVYSNEIYQGLYSDNFKSRTNLPNTPTVIQQQWTNQGPGGGAPADLRDIAFNIIAWDNEGRTNRDALIQFQVSMLDGTVWKNATILSFNGTPGPSSVPSSYYIKASPQGYTNRMVHWDAIADRVQGNRFVMRMVVYPSYQKTGKLLHSSSVYYMYGSFYINGGPNAKIVAPKDDEKVSGRVSIFGAAFDYDFNRYVLSITNASGLRMVCVTNTNAVPPTGLLYEWDAASAPSGTYGIRLSVYDRLYADPVEDSASVRVIGVAADSPSIAAVYPTNNTQDAAANSPVVVKFSRYMNENTLRDGTLRVNDGQSTLEGNVKYKSIVKALIFEANPNLSFNRTHIGNVEAAFQDVLGNPLGNNYLWNFRAEQALPESIAAYGPLYEDVETNAPVYVVYSMNMGGYTNFNDDTFSVHDLDGNKVTGTVTNFPALKTVVFIPAGGLKGSTLYIVKITKEIIPDSVPRPFSWYFITRDTVVPQVVSTAPAQGDDFFNPKENVVVHFNKTMNINMIQENIFRLADSRGNAVQGSLIYDLENNDLIFTPETALNGLEAYSASIFSRFQDMGGHSMSGDYTWNFRTTQMISSAGGGAGIHGR